MSLPPLWTPRDDMKPSLPEVPDMTLEEEPEVKIRLCCKSEALAVFEDGGLS